MASGSGTTSNLQNEKRDPGWRHYVRIDPTKPNYMQCLRCGEKYSGGVYHIKQHLASGYPAVAKCLKCPPEVREEMKNYFEMKRKHKAELKADRICIQGKDNYEEEEDDVGEDTSSKKRNKGRLDMFFTPKGQKISRTQRTNERK